MRIGNHNRKRNWIPNQEVLRRSTTECDAQERNARTVGRPTRFGILQRLGGQKEQLVDAVAVDADKGMIVARRDERERVAVR